MTILQYFALTINILVDFNSAIDPQLSQTVREIETQEYHRHCDISETVTTTPNVLISTQLNSTIKQHTGNSFIFCRRVRGNAKI